METHLLDHECVDCWFSFIDGVRDFYGIIEVVSYLVEMKVFQMWYIVFGLVTLLFFLFVGSTGYLFYEGIGIWGLNNLVVWGWAIVNFVFWVGIGHVGMLIFVILFFFC